MKRISFRKGSRIHATSVENPNEGSYRIPFQYFASSPDAYFQLGLWFKKEGSNPFVAFQRAQFEAYLAKLGDTRKISSEEKRFLKQSFLAFNGDWEDFLTKCGPSNICAQTISTTTK